MDDNFFDSKISDPLKVYQQRVNSSLQFLKDQPNFTEQNIHSWHDNILHIQRSINELAKGKQISGELEQLCRTNEQLRAQFDFILQEQYPYLRDSIRKKLEIAQGLNNERISAAQCRFFNYGSQVLDKEDRQTEFKLYTLASFSDLLFRDIIKKTMVSFLNQLGGTIFIGIRDYDMTVQGIDLTRKDMDILKLNIYDIRRQIEPDCNVLINVDFIPVMQWGSFSNGKWVVRVKVAQGELNTMYAYKMKYDDPFVFSSAFREDGSTQRYELSKFILSCKEVHQHGRQATVPIQYAPPHEQAYLCESNQVVYPDQKGEIKGKYVQQQLYQNNNLSQEQQAKIKQLEDENRRLHSDLKIANKKLNEKNQGQKDSQNTKQLLLEIKDLTQELESFKIKCLKHKGQNEQDSKQIAELTQKNIEINDENRELKEILAKNSIQLLSKNQQNKNKISSYPDARLYQNNRIEQLEQQSADSQQRKEFSTPLKIIYQKDYPNFQVDREQVNKLEDFSKAFPPHSSNHKQQKTSAGKQEPYPQQFIRNFNEGNNELDKPNNARFDSNQKDVFNEDNYENYQMNKNRQNNLQHRNDEEEKKQSLPNNNNHDNNNNKRKNPFLAEASKEVQLEIPRKSDEISKSDLNRFESWIMISTRRKDESQKALQILKDKLSKDDCQFKTIEDQNIVGVFFKNKNSMGIQKYEEVIQLIQRTWLKILVKTSGQDISEIFFGQTIQQAKNQDDKMSYPVLLFDNIKEDTWSEIQKIFGRQDIKKIKPTKYYTMIDERTINEVTSEQIKSIRRDTSIDRIGYIVGKQVAILGQDLDVKQISDYLYSCLIFQQFKVQLKQKDQIVVDFSSSLDALIGQLKLEESKIEGIAQIKLDEIMDVPLKFK